MWQKRKTKITIESERVLVIGSSRNTFDGWCPMCGELVRLVRPDEAAALAAYVRASQHPLEISKLHVIPTDDGMMNICLNSLLNQS